MKYERTETVTQTVNVPTHLVCDFCGQQTVEMRWVDDFTISNVTIERVCGDSYTQGGWVTATVLDVCPACFDNKVIPWAETQGAKARKEDRSI